MISAMIIALTFYINGKADERIPIPEAVQEYCIQAGEEFNICPELLMSLIYTESRGIVTDNITQITSKRWFKEGIEACGDVDIKDPLSNIRVCAYYLAKWAYEGDYFDVYLVLDSWHLGRENALRKYKEGKPSRYAKTIADRSAEWEELRQ